MPIVCMYMYMHSFCIYIYICDMCMYVCVYMCMCVCSGSPPAVQLSGLSKGRHTLKMTPVGCASGSKTLSLTFTT